ncbi:MAG: threonine ammonia-lyase [Verrucomicrobia bacterium]|nr:threonine ammonia-lyase [Verrucomicrobiota bacterium]
MKPLLREIEQARHRISEGVLYSPCVASAALSELTGMRIFCKLDNLQRTGSFKERGARNALLQLPCEQRERGVVAASAGNHALGLAYHGALLDIPVTVVMPRFAPLIKSSTCRRFGANVILHGETFAAAKEEAERLGRENGFSYIHGYDDPAIIAGQGTMGLEILEQVPKAEAVIVPIGGGGLIAGVAAALKARRPKLRVVGVESFRAPTFTKALRAGRPVKIPGATTLADGLSVPQIGAYAFTIAKSLVDEVVRVSEDEIALAILRILELEKTVVEGAGATPLAACLSGKLNHLRGKCVVLALCGGNIDPNILDRVIEKGLVVDGRLTRFTVVISDRPGGLAKLARLLAEAGASIKEVTHDRAFAGADVSTVNVFCTLETRDHRHVREVHRQLRQNGIRFCRSIR